MNLQRKHYKRFTIGSFCGIFRGMSTVVTNIRIDKELKAQATELFNDLGLTLSQAFTVFLKQLQISSFLKNLERLFFPAKKQSLALRYLKMI